MHLASVARRSRPPGASPLRLPRALGVWDPEPYWAPVVCPAGHVRDTAESVAQTCERADLACPPGLAYLCRPCVPDMSLEMFHVQVPRSA